MPLFDPTNIPSAEEVNEAHINSDVDKSRLSQHHTLGTSPTQASPGNHNHDGVTSVKIKATDIDGLSVATAGLPAGGAAGDVLTKNSATNYDASWITPVKKGDGVFVQIWNNTGVTLTKGQIVYTNGATGAKVTVALALATGDATSARTFGWIADDILHNDYGWVQIEGYLSGIDTASVTDGAQLYLSPTTAGAFTATKPLAPNHMVYVGVVAKAASAAGGGAVLVKTQNGYEVDEIHDIAISGLANNDILQYESSTDLWKNKTLTNAGISQVGHNHVIADVTNLQTTLDGKASTSHNHAIADVTNLQTTLDGKANLTGSNLFQPSTSGNIPISIRGLSGQSVDLLALQNNSTTAVSGFDNASNLFVNNTYYGYNTITTAPASTTFWKIATLPISTGGTYDHLIIDAVLDDSWGSNQKVHAKVILGNRNGFTYRYYLNGTVRSNCRIVTYTEADGSVSVYFRVAASSYASFSYNLTHSIAGVTIYKNPASTTTTPTGTLSFDSGVIATYTPEFYIPYTGQPIIRGLVSSSGAVSGTSFVKTGGTSSQFLKADGSSDSNLYLATNTSSNNYGSSYFAGHNTEGRIMYNAYLTNDMANARLRGSAVSATQNGVSYAISDTNWDYMLDGTATFFNISPTSAFTFPLVMTIPLPRTLTYGSWVGISFGSTTFRAIGVKIEVFSIFDNAWVTVVDTATNAYEDVFSSVAVVAGAGTATQVGNSNASGINSIRYTLSNPNSTQLRIAHLWAYNYNSDMWSQTMMPRAGGSFYGPVTNLTIAPASVPLTCRGAISQSVDLQRWQTWNGTAATTVAYVRNDGLVNSSAGFTGPWVWVNGYRANTTLAVTANNNAAPTMVVRGTNPQTQDMQQWITWNGTTETVRARVDSGGNFKANNVATLNSIGQMAESNSGALFVMGRATAQASSPGANVGTLYFRDGTNGGTLRLATRTGAAGVEETIVDNISSTASTAGATFTGAGGVNTTGGLTLSGTTSPITLNASVGTSGKVLASGGAGATPTWVDRMSNPMTTQGEIIYGGASGAPTSLAPSLTNGWVLTYDTSTNAPKWAAAAGGGGSFNGGTLTDALVLAPGNGAPNANLYPLTFQNNTQTPAANSGSMDYDGTVFYQTSNTNPGRALATQNYYYVSNSDYGPDFTVNSTAKSLLGGSTVGLTVAAGTTYEYELITAISHQFVTVTSISGDYLIVSTTVSGSPVVSTTHQVDYGSNTTGFTTATTLSTVRPTGNVTFMPAITSGTRYAFLRAKGLIRVTGTGTAKIYPAIQTSGGSGSGDNIWNVRSGTIFKLTPVGNGTVTQVGAFA